MDFDVIVAGAGPGGSLLARDLARAGFRVGLFDADQRETLGKTVIVEAEKAAFDAVGLSRPQGDEVPYHGKRIRVISPQGRTVLTVEGDHPAVALYLDRLAKKVLAEAEGAGARFHGGFRALSPLVEANRVAGVKFQAEGREQEVRGRLTVDATGFEAALVRRLPPEFGIVFPGPQEDVVTAENCLHEIDPAKAEEAVRAGRCGDEEVWNRLGGLGNYSTHYSQVSLRQRRAYVLVGFRASYPNPSPTEIIARYQAEQGYFGARRHGGRGLIRVRRSLDRLVADGLMVIGEAACQVIPAHGSGVASALYAGHLAARVAASALAAGDTGTARLWPYARDYQRGRGAVLATLDVNRLMVEELTRGQITAMMESGLMAAEDLINVAAPRALSLSPATLPGRLWGLLRSPGLWRPLGKMLSVSRGVQKLYANYPATFDPGAIRAWETEAGRWFGRFRGGA